MTAKTKDLLEVAGAGLIGLAVGAVLYAGLLADLPAWLR